MITEQEISSLRANQRFLVRELLKRNILVTVLDRNNDLLEAKYGQHYEIFFDIDSAIVPYPASIVAGSKSITKKLLQRAGLSVPRGIHFQCEKVSEIVEYANKLGYPVVLKPSMGIQGQGVHTCLECADEVRVAIQTIVEERGPCEIIVEEYIASREVRVFITKDRQFAVVHRDPAHVIGDGNSTIRQLAMTESFRRLNPRKNCLGAIVLDEEARRYLVKRKMTFDSIPKEGEKVYIRGSSNVMMGGVARDITDAIHPTLIDVCHRALLAIPSLPYAGIDVLCRDPRVPQTQTSYFILEVNSAPGIGIHMAPGMGVSRNVAGMIVDCVFPETRIEMITKKVA